MTAAQWRELVDAWESSGVPAEAFASEHRLAAASLRWWKTELERRARKEEPRRQPKVGKGVPLARVVVRGEVSATAGHVAIAVGSARILVEQGFDGSLLREVVRALGEPK